ncbi:MAG: nucleoside deaminase [Microbacteriaceae bacterium]|nr:nucleoside deaminase [Microbacteriaceae bacterium]
MLEPETLMQIALEEARLALDTGDVPVGAVIVDGSGSVVAKGRNEREATRDPTAHAEIVAIRRAANQLQSWQLNELTLVVTLEPCAMCAGAILASRIPRVIFAAWDEKAGASGSVHDLLRDRRLPHRVEVLGGILEAESQALLREFFEARRS